MKEITEHDRIALSGWAYAEKVIKKDGLTRATMRRTFLARSGCQEAYLSGYDACIDAVRKEMEKARETVEAAAKKENEKEAEA